MIELTNQEKDAIGTKLANLFSIPKVRVKGEMFYSTMFGTKSAIGIYNTIERVATCMNSDSKDELNKFLDLIK